MILRARILEGVLHGFTTREGGVSEGPYASLNLGRATGDSDAAVAENHARMAKEAGFPLAALVTPDRQVHGPEVRVADGAEAATGDCDGVMTVRPETVVGIRTADCVPVLLRDPGSGAVAAVHAGWRGIVARIPANGVALIISRFGADPEKMVAAIGPAIDACCYEVDDATADEIRAAAPGLETRNVSRAGHVKVGLRAAVAGQLQAEGLLPASIELVGGCASCEKELFFSHRRDHGKTGRQLSFISPAAGRIA